MSKKIIISLIVITIFLVGSITLAFSYAMWNVTKEQTNENIVESGCLNLEIQNEENAINLNNAYPITDSEARRLTPYTFKITNTCTITTRYKLSLEMLNGTTLNSNFVALNIDNGEKKKLNSLLIGEKTKNDSIESRIIQTGAIKPNEVLNIKLRLWMDESVELSDDAQNKILNAKVIVAGEAIAPEEYCQNNIGTVWEFDYVEDENGNGYEQKFIAPCAGNYKLETWGAQGGEYSSLYPGGYGGYSVGTIVFNSAEQLFINVGGRGNICDFGENYCESSGGYNGGGNAYSVKQYTSGGGGLTHIAKESGQLKNMDKYAGNNDSPIIIVAGGGGGSGYFVYKTKDGEIGSISEARAIGTGGASGGFYGNNGFDNYYGLKHIGLGGNQIIGGLTKALNVENQVNLASFGQGGQKSDLIECCGNNGGGGGYYGGGASSRGHGGAGGGSSYIGNINLTNKVMYCYNCEESNEELTRTISTTNVSEVPTSQYTKKGNGYARITYLGNV